MRSLLALSILCALPAAAQTPDWSKADAEALHRLQDLVRIDTTDPPGNETRVVDYLKKTFDAEGIPNIVVAKDPARANIIARLKGNGSKRPLIIMAHSDTVQVDTAKWTFPPFSATLNGGYIYGRGSLDDKSNLFAALSTMVLLKRSGLPLDRDVIFVSEAGEEASTGPGIQYLVEEHWNDIDAEIALAEGGGVRRMNGQVTYAVIQTTEKQPRSMKLISRGPSGHASRPLNQRRSAPCKCCRKNRRVGPAYALQRHHPYLFRKNDQPQQAGRRRPLSRTLRSTSGGRGARVHGSK
jgi:acetylornithine deacetylase/succinyl-diaminopimelate desuccinylase-like protein